MRLTKEEREDLHTEVLEAYRKKQIPAGFLLTTGPAKGKYLLMSGIQDPLEIFGSGFFVVMPMVLFLQRNEGGAVTYEGFGWHEDLDREMLRDFDDFDAVALIYEDAKHQEVLKLLTKDKVLAFFQRHVVMECGSTNGSRFWGSHQHTRTLFTSRR